MLPNYVMQIDPVQMQNLIGMQDGPTDIWNMGPGIAPSVAEQRGWTL